MAVVAALPVVEFGMRKVVCGAKSGDGLFAAALRLNEGERVVL